jgi:predicted ATP-binding protein involved in virulence
MLIRELHIQNFRRFEDLKVSFEEDLTVLVARNGQGKSSILDAIRVLISPFVGAFDYGVSHGFDPLDCRRSVAPDSDRGKEHWPIRVEGEIVLRDLPVTGFDYKVIKVARELGGVKRKTTVKEAADLIERGRDYQSCIHSGLTESWFILPVVAHYGPGRLWKLHKDTTGKKVLSLNRSYGYQDCLSTSSNFKQAQEWVGRATLAKFQQIERGEPDDWGRRINSIQSAVDAALEEEGWSHFQYSYDFEELSMFHPEHGRLPVRAMSSGVQAVVSLVVDLAFRCLRLNSVHAEDALSVSYGIVLIDEIEQHLHPGWQQRILPSLRKIFPMIQFIVATHSPEVLSTVDSRQIRILDNGKCYGAPAGALGAESSRLLQTVLGLKSLRPPVNEVAELNEYLELVYTGRWMDPRAVALRQKLDQLYQGEEPALLEADLQIENQEWEAAAAP